MVAKKKTSKKTAGRFRWLAPVGAGWRRIRSWHWWWRWPAYITIFLFIFFMLSSITDRLYRPVKRPVYGVSFSTEYTQELGTDWQANYTALLQDLGFKHLRLMSYWEQIEPQKGQ
jgi:hypothetical protein